MWICEFWKLVTCAIALADAGAGIDVSTLQFVHVLWRHGDRSPSAGTFASDTEKDVSTWPQGWGELTKMGMKQHYELGQYFRRRYVESGFLSKDYKATEIYIRSTSYNRTIMSALANLAGMYPVQSGQEWIGNLGWQPIPVHSVPKYFDMLLWTDLPCPTAHHIFFEEIMKSEPVRKIEKGNEDLLNYLSNATGLHRLVTFFDMWKIYDVMHCLRVHNKDHKLPDWVQSQTVFDQVHKLANQLTTFFFNDPRLKKLRGSLLFGEMVYRMRAKAQNLSISKTGDLKYYAYSAHDTTMIAFLENLEVYNGLMPPYASAVMLELHDIGGTHVVKVFYINETGSTSPIQLIMKDCGASEPTPYCSLDAFVSMAQKHVPRDWYAECGSVSHEHRKIKRLTVAAVVSSVMAGLLLIIVIVLVCILWKQSRMTKIA